MFTKQVHTCGMCIYAYTVSVGTVHVMYEVSQPKRDVTGSFFACVSSIAGRSGRGEEGRAGEKAEGRDIGESNQ